MSNILEDLKKQCTEWHFICATQIDKKIYFETPFKKIQMLLSMTKQNDTKEFTLWSVGETHPPTVTGRNCQH